MNVNDIALSGLEISAGSSYQGSICPTGSKIGSRNRDLTVFMSLNLLSRLSTRNGAIIKKFANILMLMIFAVFVQPLKRISYWKCFHNCGRLEASSLAYRDCNFCPTGPPNSWEYKGWVESNRLSTCIESTLMMSRNDSDFNLYRVDLYRNDFVLKWPNSIKGIYVV